MKNYNFVGKIVELEKTENWYVFFQTEHNKKEYVCCVKLDEKCEQPISDEVTIKEILYIDDECYLEDVCDDCVFAAVKYKADLSIYDKINSDKAILEGYISPLDDFDEYDVETDSGAEDLDDENILKNIDVAIAALKAKLVDCLDLYERYDKPEDPTDS